MSGNDMFPVNIQVYFEKTVEGVETDTTSLCVITLVTIKV